MGCLLFHVVRRFACAFLIALPFQIQFSQGFTGLRKPRQRLLEEDEAAWFLQKTSLKQAAVSPYFGLQKISCSLMAPFYNSFMYFNSQCFRGRLIYAKTCQY